MLNHHTSPNLAAARRAVVAAASDPTAAAQNAAAASPRSHLSVDGLSASYPDRRVLTDLSFTASAGDRLGLIGENGTGKSTLLRILAGQQAPDDGRVELPGSVALLEQGLPYPEDAPVSRVLDDAQAEALQVLTRIESLGHEFAERPDDPEIESDHADALETAERTGAWHAESARGEMINGLGLGGISETRTINELSGGQRLRLALAAILLRAPHLLLLDEPSNHLDVESVAYLERVLSGWPGIVIFASHDRALLDAVATKILDLDALPVAQHELAENVVEDPGSGMGVRLWGVGYSAARAARAEEMRRWRARFTAESDEYRALEHEIEIGAREVNRKNESKSESRITRKFYADRDAKVTARRARNARVRLEVLERERVRRPPEPMRFRGFEDPLLDRQLAPNTQSDMLNRRASQPEEPGSAAVPPGPATWQQKPSVLTAERVKIEGRLAPTSLKLHEGSKLLLTGPNGAGKSTLLAILAGELQPQTGSVVREVRIGYLPQEVTFERGSRSSSETYRRAVGDEIDEIVPLAATGLIAARDLDRAVGALSVGQRRRLALAMLVADPPPILLLDEPTNHLSLTLVEELEEALQGFTGTLVVASHDRWLRSQWTGQILELNPSEYRESEWSHGRR